MTKNNYFYLLLICLLIILSRILLNNFYFIAGHELSGVVNLTSIEEIQREESVTELEYKKREKIKDKLQSVYYHQYFKE